MCCQLTISLGYPSHLTRQTLAGLPDLQALHIDLSDSYAYWVIFFVTKSIISKYRLELLLPLKNAPPNTSLGSFINADPRHLICMYKRKSFFFVFIQTKAFHQTPVKLFMKRHPLLRQFRIVLQQEKHQSLQNNSLLQSRTYDRISFLCPHPR